MSNSEAIKKNCKVLGPGISKKLSGYELGNSPLAMEEGDLFEAFYVLGKSPRAAEGYDAEEYKGGLFNNNVIAKYPKETPFLDKNIENTMRLIAFPQGIQETQHGNPDSWNDPTVLETCVQEAAMFVLEQNSDNIEKKWFPFFFQSENRVYYGVFMHSMENYHKVLSWDKTSYKQQWCTQEEMLGEEHGSEKEPYYKRVPIITTQRCYCIITKRPYFRAHHKLLCDVISREKLVYMRDLNLVGVTWSPREASFALVEEYRINLDDRKFSLIQRKSEGDEEIDTENREVLSPRRSKSSIVLTSPRKTTKTSPSTLPPTITRYTRSRSVADLLPPLKTRPPMVDILDLSLLDIHAFNETAAGNVEDTNKIKGMSFKLWQSPRSDTSFYIHCRAKRKEFHVLEYCLLSLFEAYSIKGACEILSIGLMGYSVILQHDDLYVRSRSIAAIAALMAPHYFSTSVMTTVPEDCESHLRIGQIFGFGQMLFSVGHMNDDEIANAKDGNKVIVSVKKNRKKGTLSLSIKGPKELWIYDEKTKKHVKAWKCPYLKRLRKTFEKIFKEKVPYEGATTLSSEACKGFLKALEDFHARFLLKLVAHVAHPGAWRNKNNLDQLNQAKERALKRFESKLLGGEMKRKKTREYFFIRKFFDTASFEDLVLRVSQALESYLSEKSGVEQHVKKKTDVLNSFPLFFAEKKKDSSPSKTNWYEKIRNERLDLLNENLNRYLNPLLFPT